MRQLLQTSLLTLLLAEAATLPAQQAGPPVTIRAAQVINGRGGVQRNVVVTVRGSKIERVATAAGKVSYDLGSMTLLPGFIDTHVHIGWHFDTNSRWVDGGEAPDQAALYGAENAYVTLMAGFTTVQSVGAPSDKPLRDAGCRFVRRYSSAKCWPPLPYLWHVEQLVISSTERTWYFPTRYLPSAS